MRARRYVALCAAVSTAGCYTFRLVEWEEVSPPMEVRARVSAVQADRLGDIVAVEDRLVAGEVVENGGDALMLRVPVTQVANTGMNRVLYQQVTLPREGVLEVELREIHRGRTGLAVAAGTVLAGFMVYAIIEGWAGGILPGDPPGAEETVIPLLRPGAR